MSLPRLALSETQAIQKGSLATPPATPTVVRAVERWLREDCVDTLTVDDVAYAEIKIFEEYLDRHESCRIKYHWSPVSRRFTVIMPSTIHEAIVHFFTEALTIINARLAEAPSCARPSVENGGAHNCRTTGPTSRNIQPDASFRVGYGEIYHQAAFPTVVAEVAFSQKCEDAVEKAWVWLWETDLQVHAVVIYDMSYPASRWPFKARISVWERNTNNPDLCYPLHDCEIREEDLAQASQGAGRDPLAEIPSTAESRGEGTTFEPDLGVPSVWSPPGGSEQEPRREIRVRGRWVVSGNASKLRLRARTQTGSAQPVVNEQDPKAGIGASLEFRLFDFLRMCPRVIIRQGAIDNQPILVPLEPLRVSTTKLLKAAKEERETQAGGDSQPSKNVSWADIRALISKGQPAGGEGAGGN
ncbi:hypothetical protein FS749_004340 [Ceratobasidium sp. UAMH 11750]|nr:hypothetical protein FS749_004340 [Ceratobasidium sp. UAMH 11750]